MKKMNYRNVTEALIEGLIAIESEGQELTVRGSKVREVRNRFVTLKCPLERVVLTPNRKNSVFAAIAETVWVLAGRDDLQFPSAYLPAGRLDEISDDGRTLRGAYGPRLRSWSTIDQVQACLDLISRESATRRAVISLFDPARDFAESNDIPCNNWIQWMVRDQKLHMSVVLRSNDIIWGFSGINAFEWSVLHELMGLWSGFGVGEASFLAGSFHLYERHYARAEQIIEGHSGRTCYDFGLRSPAPMTPKEEFDSMLDKWFALESEIRSNPNAARKQVSEFDDPLFGHFLEILRLESGNRAGWTKDQLASELGNLPETDLTASAFEFLRRSHHGLEIPGSHSKTQAFWDECFEIKTLPNDIVDSKLRSSIRTLHREKATAYGNSWKKRGEQLSILANVARKVDRLNQLALGASASRDESLLDTAIDLHVYAIKYQTFLADTYPEVARALSVEALSASTFSDHTDGFELLLERAPALSRTGIPPTVESIAIQVDVAFNELDAAVQETTELGRRFEASEALVEVSAVAVWVACRTQPVTLRRFISDFGADR